MKIPISTIRIAKPCHENWDKMSPNLTGRHCDSCEKSVVDVSGWTNKKIVKAYQKADKGLCIRIPSDQLSNQGRKYPWLSWLTKISVGMAILFSKNAIGQVNQTDSSQLSNPLPDTMRFSQKLSIKGQVLDSVQKEEAIPFAKVAIYDREKLIARTFADIDGYFTITGIMQPDSNSAIRINCTAVAYEEVNRSINLKDSISEATIYMHNKMVDLKMIEIRIDTYTTGKMIMGVPAIRKTDLLDEYDTKTIHSEDLEKRNLR